MLAANIAFLDDDAGATGNPTAADEDFDSDLDELQCDAELQSLAENQPALSVETLLLPSTPAPPSAEEELQKKAQEVGIPVKYLATHPSLQNGGDPAKTSVPEVKVRCPPIHFVKEADAALQRHLHMMSDTASRPGPIATSVAPVFASDDTDLVGRCWEAAKHGISEYSRYISDHTDWYLTRFPARLGQYWHPVRGHRNLQRDMHLLRKCHQSCHLCAANVPNGPTRRFITSMLGLSVSSTIPIIKQSCSTCHSCHPWLLCHPHLPLAMSRTRYNPEVELPLGWCSTASMTDAWHLSASTR